MPKSPSCDCSFCENNYHCPHCAQKPEVQAQCAREAEIRAQEEKVEREKIEAIARIQQERADRAQADEILNWGGEFWGGLLINGYIDESALRDAADGESTPRVTSELSRHTIIIPHIDEVQGTVEGGVETTVDVEIVTTLDEGEETEEDVVPTAVAA
jgi:chromosome condensin MukBEF ATPase and DNA-binding subunit MukB